VLVQLYFDFRYCQLSSYTFVSLYVQFGDEFSVLKEPYMLKLQSIPLRQSHKTEKNTQQSKSKSRVNTGVLRAHGTMRMTS